MTKINEQIFCNCFGCEREILVGEKVYSLTYSFDKIEAANIVAPMYTESLGVWCNSCFSKLKQSKNYQIPWSYIQDQTR